jgi:hypothetical protein
MALRLGWTALIVNVLRALHDPPQRCRDEAIISLVDVDKELQAGLVYCSEKLARRPGIIKLGLPVKTLNNSAMHT